MNRNECPYEVRRAVRTGFDNASCYIFFARTRVRALKAVLASLRSAVPHSETSGNQSGAFFRFRSVAPHSEIYKSDTRRVAIQNFSKRYGDVPQSKIYQSGARRTSLQIKAARGLVALQNARHTIFEICNVLICTIDFVSGVRKI